MMLAYEREDHRRHVCFKREPWDEPLVQGGVLGKEHVQCHFNPGGLCTLSRVIETRQLRLLQMCIAQSRIRNRIYKAQAFEPPQVFFGECGQNLSDVGFRP